MRHAILAAVFLLAACGGSTPSDNAVSANASSANASETSPADALGNELIDNPNGTQTLRLEGNDSATFVDGELVDVNRAK